MALNPEQTRAFKQITDFIESKTNNEIICLKGYAGTGKTYLISAVISHILANHPRRKIAATAPTNKAVQVLRESSNLEGVTFKTIHSLLGLQEVILESGEIEFKREYRKEPDDITVYKVLIIDEVSMLDDSLFYEIRRYNNRLKIILMGDPAQIPPVNKDDCEPFLNPIEHGITEIQLTQIMRQADGSKIAETGMMIRDDLTSDAYNFTAGSDLDIYIMPDERAQLKDVFQSVFTSNPDARVIAWTNKKVAEYNSYIRRLIYGSHPAQIMQGEKMILNKPFDADIPTQDERILLSSNQEFEVESFSIGEMKITGTDTSVNVYHCSIRFVGKTGRPQKGVIRVLADMSRHKFNQEINRLKQEAIKSGYVHRQARWEDFYNALRCVADVSYSYAITAHKSQGSTYQECFVDVGNIYLNEKTVERNRILYTSVTRAKNKLRLIC